MENPIKMDALGVPLFSETSTKTPCDIDEKIGLAAENVLQHQFCIPKSCDETKPIPSLEFAKDLQIAVITSKFLMRPHFNCCFWFPY